MKSGCIRSFSDQYFPTFGLNTERYSISLRIQSKCRKIGTKKTPNMDTFYAVPHMLNPFLLNVPFWPLQTLCNQGKFFVYNKASENDIKHIISIQYNFNYYISIYLHFSELISVVCDDLITHGVPYS